MIVCVAFRFQFLLLTFSMVFCAIGASSTNLKDDITVLELDGQTRTINISPAQNTSFKLTIMCYQGMKRAWLNIFVNPQIKVQRNYTKSPEETAPEDMTIYFGQNDSDIKRQAESFALFSLNSILLLKSEHSFSPFNQSCIGLRTSKGYRVNFQVKNPDLWYSAYIAVGVVIFFCGNAWSRNVALQYTAGVAVGVLASVLVVVFLLTRILPQRLKMLSYLVMAVSSSASLFMFQLVKRYLQDIMKNHWQYALGYVMVAGLLSFAIVYRFGPVSSDRTLNLMGWLIQGLGLFLIYQGTQIPEASAAIILLVLTVYLCPQASTAWLMRLRFRLWPRCRRYLTEEEWQLQGKQETQKALEELKQYCRSPQCDTWSVVRHLKSPTATRFAEFINGSAHVTDVEVDDHEMFIHYDTNLNQDPQRDMEVDSSDGEDGPEFGSVGLGNGHVIIDNQSVIGEFTMEN